MDAQNIADLNRYRATGGRFGKRPETPPKATLAARMHEHEREVHDRFQAERDAGPVTYVPVKDVRAAITRRLQARLPGVPVQLDVDRGAGVIAMQVTYEDGPPLSKVEHLLEQFDSSRYDGRYPDFDDDGTPIAIRYATDCVTAQRTFSPRICKQADELAAEGGIDPRATYHGRPDFMLRLAERTGYEFHRSERRGSQLIDEVREMLANEEWEKTHG